jgi:hypothetical protein
LKMIDGREPSLALYVAEQTRLLEALPFSID